MKAVGTTLLVLVVVLAFTWIIQGNDFFLYTTFAPKYEQTRRETFEQTKSYRQGMVQELENMQFEYVKADSAHKAALADIILRRSADFPEDQMSSGLRQFILDLRRERTLSR